MRGPRTAAVLLGALALATAAGCGSSSSSTSSTSEGASGDTLASVLAQVKGLTGKQRTDKLLALVAKEGGDLTYYTSQGSAKAEDLVGAFGDAFPDVNVALYRASNDTILPRMAEEAKAGFHGADVVHVNGLSMTSLHDDGLISKYTSPVADQLVPGAARPNYTLDSFNSFVVTRNTKLVPASEAPKSWEELADPKWKGKLGIEAGDVDWYKTLHDYFVKDEGKSEQEADRIFEGILRNAVLVKGHTAMAQLMAAGELPLSVNYASSIDKLKQDGAPLEWRPPVPPIIQQPEAIAPTADPQHPAAALLFIDWVLGPEGQKSLVANGNASVRPELASAPAAKAILIDTDSLSKVEKEWDDRWEKLLRLGKVAPSSG